MDEVLKAKFKWGNKQHPLPRALCGYRDCSGVLARVHYMPVDGDNPAKVTALYSLLIPASHKRDGQGASQYSSRWVLGTRPPRRARRYLFDPSKIQGNRRQADLSGQGIWPETDSVPHTESFMATPMLRPDEGYTLTIQCPRCRRFADVTPTGFYDFVIRERSKREAKQTAPAN